MFVVVKDLSRHREFHSPTSRVISNDTKSGVSISRRWIASTSMQTSKCIWYYIAIPKVERRRNDLCCRNHLLHLDRFPSKKQRTCCDESPVKFWASKVLKCRSGSSFEVKPWSKQVWNQSACCWGRFYTITRNGFIWMYRHLKGWMYRQPDWWIYM